MIMDPILVSFFLIGITYGILVYWENKRPKKFPKGPLKFPFVGNLPQIIWKRQVMKQPRQKMFKEYAVKYGPVYSLKFGPFDAVVLNDPKLIKEAWSNYELCGRPKLIGTSERTGGTIRGILFQDGWEWSEQRRFALRHLKDFGFGKRSMENLVLDEVTELSENLRKTAGQAISTQNRFNIAVLNSLWRIVTGQRFSHDDQQLAKIMESISNSLKVGNGLVFFYPWLKAIAPELSGWNAYAREVTESTKFVAKLVQERLQTFVKDQEPQDFTDVYIHEIKKTSDPDSSFFGRRGEQTMVGTLLDLFVAGAETTSTTLTFFFLYMAIFPEKQKKVQEEIDRILNGRSPVLADRNSMPYTEATIMETLRYSSMVPTGLFHKALSDVELGPFLIPKDTFVVANLYSIHHSKDIWGDPSNFRPERFILTSDSGEQKVVKNEMLMPFSYGKRLCLGETLAKDELFLFVTFLLQQFQVSPDPNGDELTVEYSGTTNIISGPKPHQLIFTIRNN